MDLGREKYTKLWQEPESVRGKVRLNGKNITSDNLSDIPRNKNTEALFRQLWAGHSVPVPIKGEIT